MFNTVPETNDIRALFKDEIEKLLKYRAEIIANKFSDKHGFIGSLVDELDKSSMVFCSKKFLTRYTVMSIDNIFEVCNDKYFEYKGYRESIKMNFIKTIDIFEMIIKGEILSSDKSITLIQGKEHVKEFFALLSNVDLNYELGELIAVSIKLKCQHGDSVKDIDFDKLTSHEIIKDVNCIRTKDLIDFLTEFNIEVAYTWFKHCPSLSWIKWIKFFKEKFLVET